MSRRWARILARLAGGALIVFVLLHIGWSDRVVDADGTGYVGRIRDRGARYVEIETEARTVLVLDPAEVHDGLAAAFENLARRPGIALLAVVLHLLAISTSFLRWHLLLAGAALPTRIGAVFRLAWVGHLFSVLLPGSAATGDLIKALYVAHAHAGRRTRAVVTVVADRGIGIVTLCAVATAAVLAVPAGSEIAAVRGIVLGLMGAGVLVVAILFSPRLQRLLHLGRLARLLPFRRVVDEVAEAVRVYRGRSGTIAGAAGLSFLAHFFVLGAFFCYGLALDVRLPLLAVGAAIPVAQMVSAIPALPGGWGVGDAAFLAFLPAAGVPAGKAVALSLTYRVVHTLLSLPGGLWLSGVRREADLTR